MGGTELILANLQRHFPDLTNQVQVIMSRPEHVTLEDKPRILWLQDLPTDPASAVLRDPSYRTKFNRLVFASYWQQQMYNMYLNIPYSGGVVIKNGVPHITPDWDRKAHTPDKKLRFIYTSTPHRGLAVLAAAADELAKERQDWELHVYSSLKIYAWHEQDKQMEPLYARLKENPCVVYHGSQPNPIIREALQDAHVFVYPSVYQETSCMAIQEAMMSGCLAITSSLGALIETCGEWAWTMPFSEQPEAMAMSTYLAMKQALDEYDTDLVQDTIRRQSYYYQMHYSFEARLGMWDALLRMVIAEGAPEEKLILG
jgi:glycosyltransferase involved in cell wall biosynthesis